MLITKTLPVVMVSICALVLFDSCSRPGGKATFSKQAFGILPDGRKCKLYTITNANGMKMTVTDYGAIVVSLETPDRDGKMADITLGFDNLSDYVEKNPYFGCVAGRYANRIANGKFKLDGKEYTLATNNKPAGIPCHLHGGLKGFDKVLWDAGLLARPDGSFGVMFHYLSKDGEEGFPGNLDMTMTYWLTNDNEFRIEYLGTTDKPTVVNLTHHTYFCLAGQGERDILDHELMINADRYTPINAGLIPTGKLAPVEDTPLDFRKPTRIGARINDDHEQLKFAKGYDHCWALNSQDGSLALAATVHDPDTGRFLEVYTTEPGIQCYCGNFLDGSLTGKGGKVYKHRYAFCLETQHYPDSPNQPDFPSVVLRPGEEYRSITIYKFSAK